MRMTLLELVQDIANDLDSDEVNSINDTVESQQIAQIVKTCYFELINNRNWPHLKKLIQLEASGDTSKPNYLIIPDNMKEMILFKYESQKVGQTRSVMNEIKYVEPDQFLRLVAGRNSDTTTVDTVIDYNGSKLLIVNNFAPTYWTTFDDYHLVTDSYNKSLETTLQKSKTQALAYLEPTWVHDDDAIPDLPSEAFSSLLEESKSTASLKLKQMADNKAEQKAGRQAKWLARKAWRLKGGVKYDDYGRKSRK